jgi:hypothetical protein
LWSRQAAVPSPKSDDPLEQSYLVLVKLVVYIGMIFSCLALHYTSIVLSLLAGRKWGDNPEAAAVLSAFCVYTAFLAWNGTTEAFVYGVASSAADLGRLGVAHTVTGVIFGVTAPLAVARYGTVGLVAANCLAMVARSLYSLQFATKYFRKRWQASSKTNTTAAIGRQLLGRMLPHPLVLVCFAASFGVTRISQTRFQGLTADVETGSSAWFLLSAQHIAVGAVAGIVVLSVAYTVERDFRAQSRKLWNGKQE